MSIFRKFARDENGATAIEYGLIMAGIAIAIIAVINSLGTDLSNTFSDAADKLATAGQESGGDAGAGAGGSGGGSGGGDR